MTDRPSAAHVLFCYAVWQCGECAAQLPLASTTRRTGRRSWRAGIGSLRRAARHDARRGPSVAARAVAGRFAGTTTARITRPPSFDGRGVYGCLPGPKRRHKQLWRCDGRVPASSVSSGSTIVGRRVAQSHWDRAMTLSRAICEPLESPPHASRRPRSTQRFGLGSTFKRGA